MTIGKRIRAYRDEHGLTQNDFARLAGCSGVAVSLWENGARMMGVSEVAVEAVMSISEPREVLESIASRKMGLNEWATEINHNAVEHGWYDEPRTFGEVVALCHSELSEALEEYRHSNGMRYMDASGKPEGVAVEMADALIRILDWFGSMGLNVEEIVREKHTYNKSRPYRHGGRAI